MKRIVLALSILLPAVGACSKGKSPAAQCEAIYQKGDGTKPYATDKPTFIEACKKAEANTRRCLLLGGEAAFKDKSCGPGNGNTFSESMKLMQLGQGG